jgi:hypothetical protein
VALNRTAPEGGNELLLSPLPPGIFGSAHSKNLSKLPNDRRK